MSTESLQLVYPMVAMVLWTFLVMFRNIQVRVGAVRKGELNNSYFELFQGAQASELVVKTGNHLRNLFEFPLLFYLVVLLILTTGTADPLFLILAWCYFSLRVAHSLVHLTFNKIPPRFFFYILSNLVLLAMWLQLVWIL